MTPRARLFIRACATVTGDLTVGYVLASACLWIIQAAALGLFLSFLLWLLALLASLALSQYVVHPVTAVVLSDRKLDQGLAVLNTAYESTRHSASRMWRRASDLAANSGLGRILRPR